MTDLSILNAKIKELEAANEQHQKVRRILEVKLGTAKAKITEQNLTIEHLVESENEMIHEISTLRESNDKEVHQLRVLLKENTSIDYYISTEVKQILISQ